VADMDGTLLDDDKKLSDKNVLSIKKLQEFGVKFAVATGRHDSMIKTYLKHLDLHVPVISCNGAVVREPFSDQIFLAQPLPEEQSLQVIEVCREMNASFHIYGHESIFGEKISHKMLYYHNLNKTLPPEERTKLVQVPDCSKIVLDAPEPIYKFLILTDEIKDQFDIRDRLADIAGLNVCQSMPKLWDVMKEGISKAYALQKLSENLAIKRNEIAAIGDQLNDIDLIEYAGMGIAVANAEEALKAKSDMVTIADNNEDAVSEAIEKILSNYTDSH
jgi:Cof subfamily protein (haloacid dehalogenase superfamily)